MARPAFSEIDRPGFIEKAILAQCCVIAVALLVIALTYPAPGTNLERQFDQVETEVQSLQSDLSKAETAVQQELNLDQ